MMIIPFKLFQAGLILKTNTDERLRWVLYQMPEGRARQKALAALITSEVEVPVNRHNHRSTRLDKDIRRLIKDGTHELVKHRYHRGSGQQYLRQKKSG